MHQVPFIAFYRKEYVEPELNISDLWKVYQWDEKVRVWYILRKIFNVDIEIKKYTAIGSLTPRGLRCSI